MIVGLVLVAIWPNSKRTIKNRKHSFILCKKIALPYQYILAFGLFGFAGGITNWLAIKMLFDKIPGLYGSGIIEDRFVEIRETVKGKHRNKKKKFDDVFTLFFLFYI